MMQATQEAEIGKMPCSGQPRQKVSPYLKKKKNERKKNWNYGSGKSACPSKHSVVSRIFKRKG
jgi:hypothetical protein